MLWLNLAVMAQFSWPDVPVEIPFEGHRIALSPLTDTYASAVSLYAPNGTTFENGGTILNRFLSRLAWSMNSGVSSVFYSGSNNPERPGYLGRGNYPAFGWVSTAPWDNLYIPVTKSAKADLALGLYREGMSINSAPFSFLSYFKILNTLHKAGANQFDWINKNIAKISYISPTKRLEELQKSNLNIGEYLYVQGRCAVAHAYGTNTVNPDVYKETRRLELDLPIMKELAALFIEQEFLVKSHSAFNNEFDGKPTPEALVKITPEKGNIYYIPWSTISV